MAQVDLTVVESLLTVLAFAIIDKKMHPNNVMKKMVVNRMTEETIAMTRPILDSLFADAVNHIIISRR